MKIINKESCGIRKVYSTNVNEDHNYVSVNGIVNHNCVIDHGYTGEVGIHMINYGTLVETIEPGEKIAQVVLLPVEVPSVSMISENEYHKLVGETERGEGGFGSTGTK